MALTVALSQTVMSAGTVTDGVGLTVILKVCGVPGQLLAVGVTVITEVTAVLPLLMAVNDPMFPEPEAAIPIELLLLVQSKLVPATVPEKTMVLSDPPLQTVMSDKLSTSGKGLIVS